MLGFAGAVTDRGPGGGEAAVSLAQRLAALAAAMSIALVLGTTELTLWMTRSSRLNDLRQESEALADTWATYLGRGGVADSAGATQLLASWPNQHLTSISTALFVNRNGRLERTVGSDSVLLEATGHDSLALTTRTMETWRVGDSHPAWRVAAPVGSPAPTAVLSIAVSTEKLDNQSRDERNRAYLLGGVMAAGLAGWIGWLVRRWVGEPLRRLETAMEETRRHGLGEGPRPIVLEGSPELQRVAERYQELEDTLRARQQELALEERARGLERVALAEQAGAEFAHEVGTPLSTVNGHLQLLREDLTGVNPGADAVERVDAVLKQVDRLSGIVSAKLGKGRWADLHVKAVPLADPIRSVTAFMEPTFRAMGVTVDAEVRHHPGPVAQADPDLLEQILVNLLKNAAEAMPDGGRIRLATGRIDGTVWIDVGDSGPGLSPEARATLFQPFSSTKGRSGTGLGLMISRRLARAMGGDLELLAREPGTTWRILLLPAGGDAA